MQIDKLAVAGSMDLRGRLGGVGAEALREKVNTAREEGVKRLIVAEEDLLVRGRREGGRGGREGRRGGRGGNMVIPAWLWR